MRFIEQILEIYLRIFLNCDLTKESYKNKNVKNNQNWMIKIHCNPFNPIYSFSRNESRFFPTKNLYSKILPILQIILFHKISNLEFSMFHTVIIKNRRQNDQEGGWSWKRKDGRWKIEGVPPTEKSGNLSFARELFTRARRARRDKIFRLDEGFKR